MVSSITLARKSQSFVAPAAPASGETLELSAIDRVPGLRHTVRSLHVFRGSGRVDGAGPAEVIRAALSRALVEYPAFAGRFVGSAAAGEACVACTGDGAWFVEAAAECSLEDVDGLDYPLMVCEEELLPTPEDGVDPTTIPVMMQVTEFTCGGFVVGLVAVHTLADGLGATQFINAIAQLTRGLDRPSVAPVWARVVIPSPPKLPQGPSPSFQSFGFQHFATDVSSDCITHVKAEYFQVLPKDGGFYGNCFYPVTVTSTAKDVTTAGLLGVIRMIRDGKTRLTLEFAKWASGDVKIDPYQLTFEHNVLFVSDWTRLGFFEVDPNHIIPFTYADYMAVAVLGAPPMPKKGTWIMTQCVEGKHLNEFRDEMKGFF